MRYLVGFQDPTCSFIHVCSGRNLKGQCCAKRCDKNTPEISLNWKGIELLRDENHDLAEISFMLRSRKLGIAAKVAATTVR